MRVGITYEELDMEITYDASVTGLDESKWSNVKVQDVTIRKVELINHRSGERLDIKAFVHLANIESVITDGIEDGDGDYDDVEIEWDIPQAYDPD